MDLTTRYLGLTLDHPIVASASPLSYGLDGIRHLEDSGAAAVVLYSLFEEQLQARHQAYDHAGAADNGRFDETLHSFPTMASYEAGPQAYAGLVRDAKEACDIPIIASLNCVTSEGWVGYASDLQAAGADALELNIYFLPTDFSETGAGVEQRYVDITRAVCQAVDIPVSVKLGPWFSAPGELAMRVTGAGAQGLVLFNRFYQPAFDLDEMTVAPSLALSEPREMRLPLLWIAVLHGHIQASLAATTGVRTGTDAAGYLLAGADVVMTTSELLRNGPERLGGIRDELADWMGTKGFDSLDQLRGKLSRRNVADPEAFERANYIRTLQSY